MHVCQLNLVTEVSCSTCQAQWLLALVDSGNVWTGQGVQQLVSRFKESNKANSPTATVHVCQLNLDTEVSCSTCHVKPSGLLAVIDSGNIWTGPGVQQQVLGYNMSNKANNHSYSNCACMPVKSSDVLKSQAQWFISFGQL